MKFGWTAPGGEYLNNHEIEHNVEHGDPYHSCCLTQKKSQNCTALVITTCPIMLANTFFDIKLAVGLFGKTRGYGSVLPTDITTSVILDGFVLSILTCNCNGYDNEKINIEKLPVSQPM
jgi:hypothetical protein